MADFRFALEKGGLKYTCPACGKIRFVRYVDTETGEQVADEVGRCDREDSCGYHMRPSDYFREKGNKLVIATDQTRKLEPKPVPDPSFIDASIAEKSMAGYEQNNFCKWLVSVFGEEKALELTGAYYIGTSKHWPGANVFWQIDKTGQIRAGKIMLYNSETGRRVKEPINHVNWVHRVMKIEPYHLQQCLFGEHLLSVNEEKPIAIVESEKTAIVAAGLIPEYIWLATAGKNNLNKEKLKVLHGRRVTMFPDLGAFDKWKEITAETPDVRVSDILERRASDADRAAGLDIADHLLRENRSMQAGM